MKTQARALRPAEPSSSLRDALLAFADLESNDLLLMGEAMHETAIRAGQLPESDTRMPAARGEELNAAMFSNLESLSRIQEAIRLELHNPDSHLNRLSEDSDEPSAPTGEPPGVLEQLRVARRKAVLQQGFGRWLLGAALLMMLMNVAIVVWGPRDAQGQVWAAERSRYDAEIQELRDQIHALREDAAFRAEMFAKAIEKLSNPDSSND